MGFYCDKKIEPYFPRIRDVIVPSRWNRSERDALAESSDVSDQKVARVMGYALKNGWEGAQYQIFLLSELRSAETLRRAEDSPILHRKSGRGSAFVQNKRYFPRSALLAAYDTDHIVDNG